MSNTKDTPLGKEQLKELKRLLRLAFKAGGCYARNEQWPDFEEWYKINEDKLKKYEL